MALAVSQMLIVDGTPAGLTETDPSEERICQLAGRPHHRSQGFTTVSWRPGGGSWMKVGEGTSQCARSICTWVPKTFALGIKNH